jgi:hypothetical protein
MIPSTKKQRQLIAIGCSQVGIDADMRHQILFDRYGVDSSTKLSKIQAEEFLRDLAGKGFKINPKKPARSRKSPDGVARKPGAGVVRIASQAEHAKIEALAGLIHWRIENGFAAWLQKRFRIDRVRTSMEAFRVIEGLKKMFENQMKQAHGRDWWIGEYDDPGIITYIETHCPDNLK